jgi:hypothetical protein
MSMKPQRLTLLEFVKANMPDNWARYAQQSNIALIKPGQKSATIGEALVQHFWPEAREASAKAQSEYRDILEQLKELLPHYEIVADDANHKSVPLERRHWADAIFELENSAIRHGDQRWTNVEVREKTWKPGAETLAALLPSRASRRGGARSIDDDAHVDKFLREQRHNSNLSMREFVLKHSAEIRGTSVEAKIRRLQKRLQKVA